MFFGNYLLDDVKDRETIYVDKSTLTCCRYNDIIKLKSNENVNEVIKAIRIFCDLLRFNGIQSDVFLIITLHFILHPNDDELKLNSRSCSRIAKMCNCTLRQVYNVIRDLNSKNILKKVYDENNKSVVSVYRINPQHKLSKLFNYMQIRQEPSGIREITINKEYIDNVDNVIKPKVMIINLENKDLVTY